MQFYVTGYTSSIRKVEYSIRISLNCVFGKSIIQTTNTLPLIRTVKNRISDVSDLNLVFCIFLLFIHQLSKAIGRSRDCFGTGVCMF